MTDTRDEGRTERRQPFTEWLDRGMGKRKRHRRAADRAKAERLRADPSGEVGEEGKIAEIQARNDRQMEEIKTSDPRWVSDEVRATVNDVSYLLARLCRTPESTDLEGTDPGPTGDCADCGQPLRFVGRIPQSLQCVNPTCRAPTTEPSECVHNFGGPQGWARVLVCVKCQKAFPVDDPPVIQAEPSEPVVAALRVLQDRIKWDREAKEAWAVVNASLYAHPVPEDPQNED